MDYKKIVLTIIRNSWPTAIGSRQLVGIVQKDYNIEPVISQDVINECLKHGEISITDDRLFLEQPGYGYLSRHVKNE